MDTNGHEWIRMDTNGYEWIRMDTNGYEWIRMDTNGYEWEHVDYEGFDMIEPRHQTHPRSRFHSCLLVSIRGFQKQ